MKLTIDTDAQVIEVKTAEGSREISLYSSEGFDLIAHWYLKVGWNQKYTYSFSWLGRPIIQLPDDMVRVQEVVHTVAPDLIVETGVAHGGSLVFFASLCEAMDKGRVVGVDIEIRAHNRVAIEAHRLAKRISLIEGSSIDHAVVRQVASHAANARAVLIVLDSNHEYAHVMAELEAYSGLVTLGSYVVVTDGFMRSLDDVPRGQTRWRHDNPASAAEDFVKRHPEFLIEQPRWPFNESMLANNVTHWPSAYLRRVR